MFDFYIKVRGRQAIPIRGQLVGNNVEVDEVCFEFSEEWDGLVKTAVFYINEDEVYDVLMAEEKATIPHEVLVNYETVKVGVYATRNGKVYATTPVEIEIDEGIIVGANADPGEYENIYVQVLARLEDMLDVLSYQTSDVPEWEFDEDTGQGIWYVTHISHKKIRVVAMGAAVIIKIQRPDQEDVVLSYAGFEPKSFYSEEGFTVRYYKVTASTTEPTIILYDYITKMKLANIILDHDVTARELLDELWEYLSAVYMPVDRTVVGCPVRNNVTAQQIWNALTYHDMLPTTRAHAAVDKYGIVKLAGGSETGSWRDRTNDEVGTIYNIALAITSGAWSDSQMSDQSNNIVKNSVIKAYVDAVRNDKQNRIQLVRPSDIGQNGRIDNSNYQLDIYDIFSTTLTDLWIVQSKSSDPAIVWAVKIASTNGTSIAENSYTKSEVNALIGALEKMTKRKVQELPVTGEDNVIYLVPKTGETDDVYDEWMWIDNQWEHFGNTQIDLSGYVPTSRTLGRLTLNGNVSNSDFANAIISAIVIDSGYAINYLVTKLNEYFQTRQSGKGLSTEDYTTAEKTKLAGLNMDTLPQLWFNNGSTPPANPEVFEGLKTGDLCYCYYTDYNAFSGLYICTAITIDNITWRPIAKSGQGLSSNDFNDAYKEQLDDIDVTIKNGVVSNSITLTESEKKAARDWIGADGGTWEKLVDKTLESNSTIALNFSDFNFNGQYKKIKVQIRGQMQTANSNISFYRMNNSSAYQVFGQVGMTTDALYEFDLSESPYLLPTAIRDSSVELKVFNVSSNSWQQFFNGKAPINQKMNETYELKVLGSSNFLANTRVVVWGIK